MRVRISAVLAAVSLAAVAGSADAMRCRHKLISEGDPQAKVEGLCGAPTQTQRRTIYRAGIPRRDLNISGAPEVSVSDDELLIHNRSLVEVEVEVWLYNRGSSRLMREVIFHDNRVVEINVLGRGY